LSLTPGTRLGPYEIISPLGEGGMGEVYRARDTRLVRDVAIKVLPSEVAADTARRARFEREARAVAALQHPNICTIYDVGGGADGVSFLVMELLQGETLQRRLARGPLDDNEFSEVAIALTGALDAAHVAGLVHRDIKPANVFLSSHGPKILDFGLAKTVFHQPAVVDSLQSTRLADGPLTEHGSTVGTVAYMSPEQVRGEDVDVRTDLFSLGLVLYEMATGLPAFGGATSAVISAAILHEQPRPPRQIRPELSGRLEDVILKAIEKNRALRYQHVVTDERVRQTLQLMGQPPSARLSGDVARDVCVRTASTAVVGGSIAGLGNQYVLGLRAEHCGTGDLLDQEQIQVARKEDVLKALSQLATTFRTRVGESLATVQKHSTPIDEATTSSLDALKAYSASYRDPRTAIPLLKRAVEIDPNFAVAYARLALAYSALGESLLGEKSIRKAYELRDHASDKERFFIATIYDRQVTGNLEKEAETLRLWAQTYPRAPIAIGLQGGFAAGGTGQYELMIEKSRDAHAIDPNGIPDILQTVWGYVYLNRLNDAEHAVRQGIGRAPELPLVEHAAFQIAFLKGDAAGMEHQAALVRGKPSEEWILHFKALVLARAGRLEAAGESARHANELASGAGRREAAAVFETAAAVSDALYGNRAAATRHAMHVLEAENGRHVTFAAALALAIAGEGSRAQAIADDLDKRFPEDTSVRFNYLPTLRALSALGANDASRAIELLRPAATYEFAQPGISFFGSGGGSFGAMYPTYVRGAAYLAVHKPTEAAAEFQKILDHPGVVLADPMGALARLQLARALTMSRDASRANAAYQDVLAMWKDADPDLALPKQAKAELAALR
jgi:tetratricopeptide (TPR) repeat protein